jgi:hypothetical protein
MEKSKNTRIVLGRDKPTAFGTAAQPAQRTRRTRPCGHHVRRCRGDTVGPGSPADRVSRGR